MSVIELKSIRLKAFRGFKEEALVELNNGLTGIKGFNYSTNTSSGSGKSSLHLIIPYVLGYSPFSAKALQNIHTEDKIQGEVILQKGTDTAIIRRGKETSFSLNGVVTAGSVKAVNEEIDKFLELPLAYINALTFREQRTKGKFLNLTDAEKKSFLCELLDLGKFIQKIAASKQRLAVFEKTYEAKQSELNALKGISDSIPCPKEHAWSDLENTIKADEQMLAHLSEVKKKLDEEKQGYFTKVNEINGLQYRRPVTAEKLDQDKAQLAEQIQVIDKQLASVDIKRLERATPALLKEFERLTLLQKSVEASKCGFCNQEWHPDVDLNKIKVQADEAWQACEDNSEDLQFKNELYGGLVIDRQEIQKKSSEISNQITTLERQALNAFNQMKEEQHLELKNQFSDTLKRSTEINEQNTALSVQIRSNKARVEEQKKDYVDKAKAFTAYQLKVRLCESDIALLGTQIAKEEDFLLLLKTFLDKIFEEVLIEISTETNESLKNIPNTSDLSFSFLLERETGEDKIKQEIKPQVFKNGAEIDFKAMLSGGQMSAFELTMDLAVGRVISRRTNTYPGWLVIDEGFDGLGAVEKESCLELLKKESCDKVIFVIDHASELSDYFDKIINVRSKNEMSYIED